MFRPEELTDDGFLGQRLHILQPRQGYRAATDPVLLAAAVPAQSGQSVLELGCGAGVASLCLGAAGQANMYSTRTCAEGAGTLNVQGRSNVAAAPDTATVRAAAFAHPLRCQLPLLAIASALQDFALLPPPAGVSNRPVDGRISTHGPGGRGRRVLCRRGGRLRHRRH